MLAGDKRKELRHGRHTVSLLTDHMVFSSKYRPEQFSNPPLQLEIDLNRFFQHVLEP